MTTRGRKGIGYDEVVRACKELEAQGEHITIRKVINITGGSFSTISQHIRKWQQASIALRDSKALPEDLITAIKTAYMTMFDHERKLNEDAIERERKILNDALKEIVDLESHVETLSKESATLKQHYANLIGGYERKLAAAESKASEAEKREQTLSSKLDHAHEALKKSEIKTAIAETKAIEYEKQLALLKSKA